jgi:ProP effector
MSTPSAAVALIELLAERFPKSFFIYEVRRRPLKVGIFQDLLATRILGEDELHAALRFYCNNKVYRSRLVVGAVRIDLVGNPAGVVTHEQVLSRRPKPKQPTPAIKSPEAKSPGAAVSTAPKRHSLADLRAAALARKAMGGNQ